MTNRPEADPDGETVYTLDWTTAQQARASDPRASAWVAANAGSGKTHVLSQRVIRLLLNGARPSTILCLTYTKAAASEMSNRVFERLAGWTRASDADLTAALTAIEGRTPDARRLAFARQLFAVALETPGSLKIQTIHAFCEAVLHQFPLEANVAGHFSVMDDGETAALLAEAKRSLLAATTIEGDARLAAAFAAVLDAAGEQGMEALLDDLIAARNSLAAFVGEADRQEGVEIALAKAAGIAPDATEAAIRASIWPLPGIDVGWISAFRNAADAQKNVTPQKFARAFCEAAAARSDKERWTILSGLFLRQDGEPASTARAGNGAVAARMPEAQERIDAAAAHFVATLDRLKIRRMLDVTAAALTLAARLNADYERLKRQRGRLDFDDLVQRTAGLLARQGASAWVHYKLDQGIDHILVDEAQDTSPAQWSIIRGLASEFFAGERAGERLRTLFSVGDEKQSIYSFQGARPERFREEGRQVAKRASEAENRFENVELKLSFRSTADVLKAVDHVFAEPDNSRGLSATESGVEHASVRGREPGIVDVWPMIGKERKTDEEDWTAPFDDTPESDPRAVLARRVAAQIRAWIGTEHLVRNGRRQIVTPGDIIVLVRKRDGFVNALMRELKQAPAVAVAGADRLVLTDHIAVQDLMALGRYLALPDDDLSLAALLKSPLFDMTEDDVFRLAAERPNGWSVARHLSKLAAAGEAPFADAEARLSRFAGLARSLSVHGFYAELLGPEGGRARFLARLGSEAADVLDEFLAFALDHEASSLPGLQSFLAVLDAQSPTIKRELAQGRDEIRIMTVHASKGLEAPIVFLVDSGGEAARAQQVPKLRSLDRAPPFGPVPLWVPGKDFENSVSKGLKQTLIRLAEEEYRRLLYVGMTRAADRLVVCGYHGLKPPAGPHWLGMVEKALAAREAAPTTFTAGGASWEGLRFRLPGDERVWPEGQPMQEGERERTPPPLPLGLLPPPSRPPRPLMPSGAHAVIEADAAGPMMSSPLFERTGNTASLERGRIVHRFLQVLPGLDPAEREAAARRYLDRAVPDWPAEMKDDALRSTLAVLDDPAFGPVFDASGEAEVAIMGTLKLGARDPVISGRIDRIAVFPDRVLIVDYKTNRPPCLTLDAVLFAYRAQMALYRGLLAPLYPGRRVEAALLFTEAPVLIPIPAGEMEAALAALAAK